MMIGSMVRLSDDWMVRLSDGIRRMWRQSGWR